MKDETIWNEIEKMSRPGTFIRLFISDCRDMGYKQGFKSVCIDGHARCKGNTVRAALVKAIQQARKEQP